MRRSPFVAILLFALTGLGATACDDGGSDRQGTPRRSSTSSSSTTSTSGGPTSSTASSVPPTAPPTTPTGSCGNQTDAIVDAINGKVGGFDSQNGLYTVQQCRLAASSPIWAAAELEPEPGMTIDRATIVLQRVGALWTVMYAGTGTLECVDTPPTVVTDLGIDC